MNETIRGLHQRKSVRVFEATPISPEVKNTILDAALQAPTAGCQMLYTILDIQNPALKEALAKSCDGQQFIADAPMVLVFLADCRRWPDLYAEAGETPRPPGAGDLLLACQDAVIAAQNTVVAAHALGLGSCYIGDILENCEEVTRLLQLDAYTLPITMLVYGYPTPQQAARPKPARFEKQYIVQTDTYRRLAPDELRQMLHMQQGGGFDFDKFVSAFCARKYTSAFAQEMNRSAAQYLGQFML